MKITVVGDYTRIEHSRRREDGCDRHAYFIKTELLTLCDWRSSPHELMSYADFVVCLNTNTIIKCRWDLDQLFCAYSSRMSIRDYLDKIAPLNGLHDFI